MGGGIMQLTASGMQDNYITGNPQITFFKSVYRRHTNFAIECVQQIIDGDLGTEETVTNSSVKITKTADLLSGIYVVCPQKISGINGTELIKSVELIIGGTLIDRHTNEWMKVWDELTIDTNKREGYKYMTGGFNTTNKTKNHQATITIPLKFWFCRHIGLSLPLISIQYHDILLKIEWGINSKINRNGSSSISSLCEVWCDNVFLDSDERKRFGENEHEYLIEQLQTIDTLTHSPSTKFKLNSLNHPVKEILWTENDMGSEKITDEKINITINGIDRMSEQYKEYYSLKQPFIHHTNIPSYNVKEHEEPILLEIPIDSGIRMHDTNPNTIVEVDYLTKVELGQNYVDYNNSAVQPFRVGDILSIWRALDISMSQMVTVNSIEEYTDNVTEATTKRVSFSPDLYGTPPDTSGTNIRCYIIGRRDYSRASYSKFNKNIYLYSFCLNPEEHQPSGTCNYSRLDDSKLNFSSAVSIDTIFATNYNILRISNGLTSLRFAD